MNNLFFNNDIVVTIVKSPENPIEGDDVVFTASVNIDQPTGNYSDNSTYFFSYTWMESQDGGISYYKVGQDLDNLTIPNIPKTFFNNLYKVQVRLIDLDDIILTEDGDNLTTQFGEILIGNNTSSNMGIQSTNNLTISDTPAINANTNVTALDITNLNAIIDEAIVYDTTLNDTNKAIVLGGQINVNKNNNSQIISGNSPQQISLENLPDTNIEIPNQQLGIQSSSDCKKKSLSSVSVSCAVVTYCSNKPPCNQEICVYGSNEQVGNFLNYKIKVADGIFQDTYEYRCCKDGYVEKCRQTKAICNNGQYLPSSCGSQASEEVSRGKEANYEAEMKSKCGCKNHRKVIANITKQEDKYIITSSLLGGTATWFATALYVTFGWKVGGVTVAHTVITLGGVVFSGGVAIALGLLIAAGAGIYYFMNDNGETLEEADCFDKYYLAQWSCSSSDDIYNVGLNKSFVAESRTPPSYSNCTCATSDGIGSGYVVISEGKDCNYVIDKKCGPINSTCRCDRSTFFAEEGSTFPSSITFDITGDEDVSGIATVGGSDLYDCVNVSGCEAECKGMNCCGGDFPKFIWDINSSGGSVVCNARQKLFSASAESGSPDIFWEACQDATATSLDLITVTITQRFRGCGEKSSGSSFTDISQAQAYILSLIGDKIGLVVQYKLVAEPDTNKWQEIGTIKISRNETKKLYNKGKSQFDGYKWINKSCDMCKPIYSLSVSGDSYPCFDKNYCGINLGNCNVTSLDSTDITLATISKIEDPTKEQVAQAKRNTGGYYMDLGLAKSVASIQISASGKPGVIMSSPCPD